MKARLLLTLLLAGGITGVFWQRNAISQARRALELRRDESRQIETLMLENARVAQLRQENLEIGRIRAENQELYKLRNEVRQLREQAPQLPGLRAENERLRSAQSASADGTRRAGEEQAAFIRTDNLTFSGYASPEAAFQSMMWAMSQGNAEQVLKSVSPDLQERMKDHLNTEGIDSMKREAERTRGFRVAATKMVSDAEALLGLQIEVEGQDQPQEVAVPLKRVGSEWRVEIEP